METTVPTSGSAGRQNVEKSSLHVSGDSPALAKVNGLASGA